MKKLVQIPRFTELNPYLVMNFVFDEITPGFKYLGFEVRVVNKKEELEDGGLIFFDDKAYKTNRQILDYIGLLCPNSVAICWYWQDMNYKPFQYMIHTGEYYLKTPTSPEHLQRFMTYMKFPTYVPLVFRPNELPTKIGTYERNVLRDYCYMGAKYKSDWVPSSPEFTGIYNAGDWDVYLPYDKRREIYLSSTFALGFHDTIAIDCGSISARIFEGLIYGCVVFCESEFVCEYTENTVVHIKSKGDLENKMRYYKNNPELIKEKQLQGYNWMRTKGGTNMLSCSFFLNKIKEQYKIDFY